MADIEIRQESPTAFYIKVHETDNVAIIVNDRGLKAGTRFLTGSRSLNISRKAIKSRWSIFPSTVKSSAMAK